MAAAIALIVGLGNPGTQYAGTRHNAGFWCIDAIAAAEHAALKKESKFAGELGRFTSATHECRLLKPLTFMNDCGRAVGAAARYFAIEPASVLVAHDDLDLPVGTVRLKVGGGHGGHNGLRDIALALGSNDYVRLRLGIGRPPAGADGADYVLSRPPRADRDRIEAAIARVLAELPRVIAGELHVAMNALNRTPAEL